MENNVDILLEELNETNGPNLTNKEAQEMVDNAKETQKDQSAKKCCWKMAFKNEISEVPLQL